MIDYGMADRPTVSMHVPWGCGDQDDYGDCDWSPADWWFVGWEPDF